MKMNDMLPSHGILVENDGRIHDLLVPRQTGFGFGEHGVAPAACCVAPEHETATVHGWKAALLGAVFESR